MRKNVHSLLEKKDHRPWPLPNVPWIWQQSWRDLGFLHYPVAAGALRRRLPEGLKLDTFGGSAWVGLVPFRMERVKRRTLPKVPGCSSFPELNLRTYVEADGKPGVWFFSLDADSWPIVLGGRWIYGLPYYPARMEHREENGGYGFSSHRRGSKVCFRARYRACDERFYARPGSFEYWATERYCLYAGKGPDRMVRVEVHHAPWPLQRMEVAIEQNDVLSAAGIHPLDAEPLCHFSEGVDVLSFPVEPCLADLDIAERKPKILDQVEPARRSRLSPDIRLTSRGWHR